MKIKIILATVLLFSISGWSKKKDHLGNLETNMSFRGSSVHGQKLAPIGLNTMVDDDKYLDELVGPRIDFKDRQVKIKK